MAIDPHKAGQYLTDMGESLSSFCPPLSITPPLKILPVSMIQAFLSFVFHVSLADGGQWEVINANRREAVGVC
jgi:hypothetical protein